MGSKYIYVSYIYMKYITVKGKNYPEHFIRGVQKKPANVAYMQDDSWKGGFYLITVIVLGVVTARFALSKKEKDDDQPFSPLTTYIIQVVIIFLVLGGLLAFHSLVKKSNKLARASFWVGPY